MDFLRKIIRVAIVLVVIVSLARYYILDEAYDKKYEDIVEKVATKYEIDSNLIYAIIKTESGFNKDAKSGAGAIGLMQIMPGTAKEVSKNIGLVEFDEDMLYEPEVNIEIGTSYYKTLLDKYENKELALIAYNAGQGNVDKWINDGVITDQTSYFNLPYKETTIYWQKVMSNYTIYNYLYYNIDNGLKSVLL